MVLSIATDPFFQQLVTYPSRLVPSSQAWISRATMYTTSSPGVMSVEGIQWSWPDFAMRYFILPMLYSTKPLANPDIPSICPTGSCSFQPYQTLAVCNACSDISHMLEYKCLRSQMDWTSNVTNASMPTKEYGLANTCGYYLNVTSDSPALMVGYGTEPGMNQTLLGRTLSLNIPVNGYDFYNRSILFRNVSQPIHDFIVVGAPCVREEAPRTTVILVDAKFRESLYCICIPRLLRIVGMFPDLCITVLK